VDLGPIEFQAPLCFGDADFDGRTSFEDLYVVHEMQLDMNGDGQFTSDDTLCVRARVRLYEVSRSLNR
jgi:hypothetical protein